MRESHHGWLAAMVCWSWLDWLDWFDVVLCLVCSDVVSDACDSFLRCQWIQNTGHCEESVQTVSRPNEAAQPIGGSVDR